MSRALDFPAVMFVAAFGVLWVASRVGQASRKRRGDMDIDDHADFGMILTATLTLLGLIIGFTFSMAISRYDQRKNYEEAEANAIGTEYLRADLLPPADAQNVRSLLKQYLEQRIQFYSVRWPSDVARVNAKIAQVQTDLWNAVRPGAANRSRRNGSSDRRGNERRAQLARLHAGCMVESHSSSGLGTDVDYRDLL